MSSTRRQGKSDTRLAKGQLWKLNHLYIQIVQLGKKVIEYRMLSDLKETGARTKTSGPDVLCGYLRSRRARLVHDSSPMKLFDSR